MTAARSVHVWFPATVSQRPSPGFTSTTSAVEFTVNVLMMTARAGRATAARATAKAKERLGFTVDLSERRRAGREEEVDETEDVADVRRAVAVEVGEPARRRTAGKQEVDQR